MQHKWTMEQDCKEGTIIIQADLLKDERICKAAADSIKCLVRHMYQLKQLAPNNKEKCNG